jgi:predicted dithiol-disulfide oxidoreductase (DUF899 family)
MSSTTETGFQRQPVVSQAEWLTVRMELLAREKELTRARDAVAEMRRKLPWVKVEKPYVFESVDGPRTLADLFDGRSQLVVQHFMFGPDWEAGCIGCSFKADHVDAARQHLEQHDVSFVAIARAPLAKIEAYRRRMGWQFAWVSSFGNEFNFDFHVSFDKDAAARDGGKVYYNFRRIDYELDELPGESVFYKDESGAVFHTYSTYARGDELLVGAYNYLDLTPKGRQEVINGNLMDWVKRHDEYDRAVAAPASTSTSTSAPASVSASASTCHCD